VAGKWAGTTAQQQTDDNMLWLEVASLQHAATHCNILNTTGFDCGLPYCNTVLQLHTATHCNTLQHTAIHCISLQHTATLCSTLQHTAAHCSTLQHTASHCNTLMTRCFGLRNIIMLRAHTVSFCDDTQSHHLMGR